MNDLLRFAVQMDDDQRKRLTVHIRRAILEEYVEIANEGELGATRRACDRLADAVVAFLAGEYDKD